MVEFAPAAVPWMFCSPAGKFLIDLKSLVQQYEPSTLCDTYSVNVVLLFLSEWVNTMAFNAVLPFSHTPPGTDSGSSPLTLSVFL